MRTKNINIKITISIPYTQPDLNGVQYSKEAVQQMMQQLQVNKPIIFRPNEDDNPKLIGQTIGSTQELDIDYENGVCKLTIDGIIYCGGADIKVNEFHQENGSNVVIDNFDIDSVGFSLE